MTWTHNWGGNLAYHAARWHRPRSLDELRTVVREAAYLRVLGTRHSFNGLADTPADLVSLEHFGGLLDLDPLDSTVTIEGGVQYGALARFLHARGLALSNLASLPHLSVAGACATGTHGSGDRAPNLAAAVSALEFVTADGEVCQASRARDGARFGGLVVSLGALGVVTRLTLDVEPSYQVRQDVYEDLPLAQVTANFDAVMAGADSVSLFTTWQRDVFHSAWLKRRVTPGDAWTPPRVWFGSRPATRVHHPIPGLDATNCTPQGGVPGPWFERWPHFRLDHTPSSGAEIQSEYLLPRAHAPVALEALFSLGERLAPLLLVSEVRTVAADDQWLSPCHRQDCVAIHFTWRPQEEAVRPLVAEVEAALAEFGARPHWGKLFLTPHERLRQLYPRLPDFQALCATLDPQGKFRNAFLGASVFGDSIA